MSIEHTNCPKETIVSQLMKVQTQVTINPIVTHGRPKVYCLDSDISHGCNREENPKSYYPAKEECSKPNNKCSFILTQLLCVEIPIELDVDVDVDKGIVCCGRPGIGSCDPRHKEQCCDDE